jgi:hypothetical protein
MNDSPSAAGAAPTYLGDSVYARLHHGMIVLYTDNGFGPSNVIALEPEVFHALSRYAAVVFAKGRAAPDHQ